MSPHSLSSTTCNPYEHIDDRYLGSGWHPGNGQYAGNSGGRYADGDQYPSGGQYPENCWHQDDSKYPDTSLSQGDKQHPNNRWYDDDKECLDTCRRPCRKTRQKPCPTHGRNRHKERSAHVYLKYSSASGDYESDQDVKRLTRKKAALVEKISFEDQIKTFVEEFYEKKIAEDRQQKADEKEEEEKRLAAEKETEGVLNVKIQQALADYKEAIEKETADEKLKTKQELEFQQQIEREKKAAVDKALADKAAADAKAAADRDLAAQAKKKADAEHEERFNSVVAQGVQEMLASRMEKEAEDTEAAEKEKSEKEKAEKMESILTMVKNMTAQYDSMKENNTPKKTATPEEMGFPVWLKNNMPIFKELVGTASKDDSGHGAASQKEEADSKDDIEIESLRLEVSDSKRDTKDTVRPKVGAKAPKQRKGDGKSTRKAKGEEGHREYKDVRSKKNGRGGSRKPAMYVMRWFAGTSYM
jgi:hypothetical protein